MSEKHLVLVRRHDFRDAPSIEISMIIGRTTTKANMSLSADQAVLSLSHKRSK